MTTKEPSPGHGSTAIGTTPGIGTDATPPGALREAAAHEDWLLEDAANSYAAAFAAEPANLYAGLSALALNVLRTHLGGQADQVLTERIGGGMQWALDSSLHRDPRDVWAQLARAEYCLLRDTRESVQRSWKDAASFAGRDASFVLDSARQQLQLYEALGFRPELTAEALAIVEHQAQRRPPPFTPGQVLLFTGHTVDAPGRPKPRFPREMVPAATAQIERALDELGAGPEDLALTQGAAGGDLIFTEACQARGVRLQWLQPLPEPDFLEASVSGSGDGAEWRRRYFAAKAGLHPADPPRTMPAEIGPLPKGVDKWERGNLWLLYTALAHGPDKARFVCLWDGGGSDGPGGTRHMFDEVKRRTGRVSGIDTRAL